MHGRHGVVCGACLAANAFGANATQQRDLLTHKAAPCCTMPAACGCPPSHCRYLHNNQLTRLPDLSANTALEQL